MKLVARRERYRFRPPISPDGIAMLRRIVSGGQTGVDRAALDWALARGFPCGGWCPAGRLAEDGPIPAEYPLTETPAAESSQRTEWNVRDSDATLIVAPRSRPGGRHGTDREIRRRLESTLLDHRPIGSPPTGVPAHAFHRREPNRNTQRRRTARVERYWRRRLRRGRAGRVAGLAPPMRSDRPALFTHPNHGSPDQ